MTSVNSSFSESVATLGINGRFDFSAHQEFRSAAKAAIEKPAVREIHVNLSKVDYIDSAALGMLLLTRENANAANKTTVLVSPSGIVQQVLGVANFQKLFEIR